MHDEAQDITDGVIHITCRISLQSMMELMAHQFIILSPTLTPHLEAHVVQLPS